MWRQPHRRQAARLGASQRHCDQGRLQQALGPTRVLPTTPWRCRSSTGSSCQATRHAAGFRCVIRVGTERRQVEVIGRRRLQHRGGRKEVPSQRNYGASLASPMPHGPPPVGSQGRRCALAALGGPRTPQAGRVRANKLCTDAQVCKACNEIKGNRRHWRLRRATKQQRKRSP